MYKHPKLDGFLHSSMALLCDVEAYYIFVALYATRDVSEKPLHVASMPSQLDLYHR